jgi:hypothetical protein
MQEQLRADAGCRRAGSAAGRAASGTPPAEQVGGALPDLVSVIHSVPEEVPTVVVRVDEEGGELLVPADAQPETVEGRTKPPHKARGGGWSYRAMQARIEETSKRNAAPVAALVDERVRAADARLLVIMGNTSSRARLRTVTKSAESTADCSLLLDLGVG